MAPQAGTVLRGDIVLERELGSGAMGVVWVARHKSLDADVAVKILNRQAVADEAARARFEREAKAIAKIDSPHVVRIFDVGVSSEGDPFIVMELLRGEDLKHRITDAGPLSVDQASTLLDQICAALGRAHELGIIHRDIKPANIFLAEGGAGLFVKLLDFGIAKVADSQGLSLTMTESLVGTPYYMSPEQFLDARTIDHRSDLWSVAVVLYAALTGKLPFLGESIGALAISVHGAKFSPPSTHRSDLSPALDEWFKSALASDRELRPQSAAQLARSFSQAKSGAKPELPEPKPAPSPTAQLAREEPTQPGPSSDARTSPEPGPAPTLDGAAKAAEKEGGRSRAALVVGAVVALGAAAAFGFAYSRWSAPAPATATIAAPATSTATATATETTASTATGSTSAPEVLATTSASTTEEPLTAASTSATSGASLPAPGSTPAAQAHQAPTGTDLAPGERCAKGEQCMSGFCTDGVCCKEACGRKCFACNGRKKLGYPEKQQDGSCGYVEFGLDPDNECAGNLVCDGLGGCGDPSHRPW